MQASQNQLPVWHGTTILTVRKGGKVVIGGDGQVSIGQTVIKSNAKKVRRLGKGEVIGGFAGATADAFTLFERLEKKVQKYSGALMGGSGELAKGLGTHRHPRRGAGQVSLCRTARSPLPARAGRRRGAGTPRM